MTTRNDFPIRMLARVSGNGALIKALLVHPMENGFTKDAAGNIVPAHFITDLVLYVNDEVVTRVHTGSGIATDPLFGWRIAGVKAGDRVRLSWRDNLGQEKSQETTAQ